MVTGEHPGENEESPPVDEVTLQNTVTKEAFFVDFLRADEHDEDGVRYHSRSCGRYIPISVGQSEKSYFNLATVEPRLFAV